MIRREEGWGGVVWCCAHTYGGLGGVQGLGWRGGDDAGQVGLQAPQHLGQVGLQLAAQGLDQAAQQVAGPRGHSLRRGRVRGGGRQGWAAQSVL